MITVSSGDDRTSPSRLAVRADAHQGKVLEERMHLGHAVHGGRRDVDNASNHGANGRREQRRSAVDVDRHDLLPRPADRQRGSRVHEHVRAVAKLLRAFGVAHVAADLGQVSLDRVVHRHDVERADVVALRQQMPREVQAEKTRTSGDRVRSYGETVTACVGFGTGLESTSTAAASRTAIPTDASPSRLRESLPTIG